MCKLNWYRYWISNESAASTAEFNYPSKNVHKLNKCIRMKSFKGYKREIELFYNKVKVDAEVLNGNSSVYQLNWTEQREVSKQVANNHNRYYGATVTTQMSWNYDPLSAGKHSITSQFPLLAGQLRVSSELFHCIEQTSLPGN